MTLLELSRWTERGGSYRTIQRFFYSALPWGVMFWLLFQRYLFNPNEVYLLAGVRVWFVLGTFSGGVYIDLPVVAAIIAVCISMGVRFGPGRDRANIGLALLSAILILLCGIVIDYLVGYGIANREAIILGDNPPPVITAPLDVLKVLLLHFLSNMPALVVWMIGIGIGALVNLSYSRRHILKRNAEK